MIEGFTGLGDSKSTGRGSFFHEDEARLKADVVASTPLPITIDPTDKVMEGVVRFSNYMTENIRASESPTITDLINADGNLRSIVPNGFILIANKLDALIQDEAEGGGGLGGLKLRGGGSGGGGGGSTALDELVASAVGVAFGTAVGSIGTAVGGALSSAVGGLNLGAMGTALGVAIVPLLVGAVAEFAENARYKLGEMALSVYEQGYDLNERLIKYASKAFAIDINDTNGDGRISPYENREQFLKDKKLMSDMLSFDKGNAWNQRMLSMYASEGGANFTLLPTVEEQFEAYKKYLDWREDNGWSGSDAQRFESFMMDNYRESTARLYSTKMNAESLFDATFDANDLKLMNGYKGYYSGLSDEKIEQLISYVGKALAVDSNDANGSGKGSLYGEGKKYLADKEGMSTMLSFDKDNAWNQRMLSMYVSEGGTNFTLLPTVGEQYEAYKGYLDWRDDNGWNGSDAQRFESFMMDNYRESTARLYSTKMDAESLFDATFDVNDLKLMNGYKGYYSELSDEKIEQLIEMLEKSVKAIEDNTESVVGNTEATEVGAIVTTATSGGRYSELKAQREAEKKQTASKGVQNIMSQSALDSIYKMNPLVPTGAYGSNMSMMAPELMTQADYAPTGTVFSMPSSLVV